MTLISIDKNNLAKAVYDEENFIIIYQTEKILANQNTEKIKALLESCMRLSCEQKVLFELVDLRNLRGNFNKILPFLIETYYPCMYQNGMQKAAYIVSHDLISFSLVQDICEKNKLIETRAFYDCHQAENWLLR